MKLDIAQHVLAAAEISDATAASATAASATAASAGARTLGAWTLGASREARSLGGYRLGHGPLRVSLVAGCHADEPVGPRLLRKLVGYLLSLRGTDPLLTEVEWWIVPHANPDGEARNAAWAPPHAAAYDPVCYLRKVVRELPGDDIEFGFPRSPRDAGARPENRAIAAWWRTAAGPFALHCSLHGMGVGGGPWFLIDPAWSARTEHLRARCRRKARALGYRLHDVERRGEKGFRRLGPGFSTRPDSRSMRRYFRERDDPETAARFRPSSFEWMRAFGGDPLTLVTEMPLFITPGVGEILGPPDPVAEAWRARIAGWQRCLASGAEEARVGAQVRDSGLRPMPVRDQWLLQWTLIAAGLETVSG